MNDATRRYRRWMDQQDEYEVKESNPSYADLRFLKTTDTDGEPITVRYDGLTGKSVSITKDTCDAINPPHYKLGWSDDAELISITENLTGNAAQVVQYVARSCRLDRELIKGDPVEDIKKAIWYLNRELRRIGGQQ